MENDPSNVIITCIFREHALSVIFCSQNRIPIKGIRHLRVFLQVHDLPYTAG